MSNTAFIKQKTGLISQLDTKSFEIKVLSPVHIGSGREFTKELDFATTEAHTLLFDLDKLFHHFKDDSGFLGAIENGNISTFLDHSGVDRELFHKKELTGSAAGGTLREFMTLANGKPVIPGSSLKGAIRTALFTKYFQGAPLPKHEYLAQLTNRKEFASQNLDTKYLATKSGGKKSNYDIGRVIRVGDVEFSSLDLEVMNVRVMNLMGHNGPPFDYGWKKLSGNRSSENGFDDGTPISTVVLGPDAKSEHFQISLDLEAFDHIKWPREERFDWTSLAKMLNNHAERIIDYESHFLQEVAVADDNTAAIADDLKREVKSRITSGEKISWIQQVGWGTGWHSKTGLHMADAVLEDVRRRYHLGRSGHPVFPKSRKIAPEMFDQDNEQPQFMMGWIKVQEI